VSGVKAGVDGRARRRRPARDRLRRRSPSAPMSSARDGQPHLADRHDAALEDLALERAIDDGRVGHLERRLARPRLDRAVADRGDADDGDDVAVRAGAGPLDVGVEPLAHIALRTRPKVGRMQANRMREVLLCVFSRALIRPTLSEGAMGALAVAPTRSHDAPRRTCSGDDHDGSARARTTDRALRLLEAHWTTLYRRHQARAGTYETRTGPRRGRRASARARRAAGPSF